MRGISLPAARPGVWSGAWSPPAPPPLAPDPAPASDSTQHNTQHSTQHRSQHRRQHRTQHSTQHRRQHSTQHSTQQRRQAQHTTQHCTGDITQHRKHTWSSRRAKGRTTLDGALTPRADSYRNTPSRSTRSMSWRIIPRERGPCRRDIFNAIQNSRTRFCKGNMI
jgi:hypothetical protein